MKQIGNLLLVSLQLIESLPQVGVHIGGVLQLQQHQRQAVDEQDDVGATSVLRPLNAELIDRQPVVAAHIRPVNQPHEIAPGFAILLVLHRHTADQQAMEQAVRGKLNRQPEIHYLLERILACSQRHLGIELGDGGAQAFRQYDLAITLALRAATVMGDIRAVKVRVTQLAQPFECFFFKLVFGHSYRPYLAIAVACA